MTDLRRQTIETYNHSATELAEFFKSIGARTTDIEIALELAGNPAQARVVEIGCGDGRDAREIVGRVGEYFGFDISEELVKLAREKVPEADFEVADLADFEFPENLDVVYAFASLLHSDQTEVRNVINRVHAALRPGGILFVSLKHEDDYKEKVQEDRFGIRVFYYYQPEFIEELAGQGFETAYLDRKTIGETDWFEIALRKV